MFLEGVLQWALEGGRVLGRVLSRGSKKGLSRRHLEGRNTPFQEYDTLCVSPDSLNASPSFRFGRRGLLEKGSFQKSPFSRDPREEVRDSRDSREPPRLWKTRIRPFLEILENLEMLEIPEIPLVKNPFRSDAFPPVPSPSMKSASLH